MTEPNCRHCANSIAVWGADTLRRLITHRGYTDDMAPPWRGSHLVCEKNHVINCKPRYRCGYERAEGSDDE